MIMIGIVTNMMLAAGLKPGLVVMALDVSKAFVVTFPLRLLLPPCWLVLTPKHPLLWDAAGLAALGLSYILFRKRGER
mgnify:CR=1 FL=1